MSDSMRKADPCVMIIFGATGDLTKRKLFPALYNLAKDDFLPHTFAIIGVGRQEMTTDEFRKQILDNFFYYLATPPNLFADVTQKIVKNGLGKEENGNWRRFIYEKPFGRDLASAKKLNADLLKTVKEQQIYRIDHYLGK